MNHLRLLSLIAWLACLAGCHNGLRVRADACMKLAEPLQVGLTEPIRVGLTEPLKIELPNNLEPLTLVVLRESGHTSECVAILDVDGALLNRNDPEALVGENPVSLFREKLDAIARHPQVRGVVLRLNSPGGSVLATEVMHQDLLHFKHQTGHPIVACIMDVGAGGGYYLATAADAIVCHRGSLVGGIGVVVNLTDIREAMATMNVFDQSITAGDHIRMGSNLDALPESVETMFQEMANDYHRTFQEIVTTTRPITLSSEAMDGRVVTGPQALELGLVDGLADLDEAVNRVCQLAGIPASKLVMFRRPKDHAGSAYALARQLNFGGQLLPFSVPGLEKQPLPTFLYMWQPTPNVNQLSAADHK